MRMKAAECSNCKYWEQLPMFLATSKPHGICEAASSEDIDSGMSVDSDGAALVTESDHGCSAHVTKETQC